LHPHDLYPQPADLPNEENNYRESNSSNDSQYYQDGEIIIIR